METTGNKLKQIRIEKGISLEEAHKKTKIHLNILKALEGDSVTNLNPVYLKSFVKIYCAFLKVDPKEFLPEQKAEQKASGQQPPREQKAAVEKKDSRKLSQGAVFSLLKNASIRIRSFQPSQRLKKIALAVIAAIVLIFLFFNLGKFVSSRRAASKARARKTQSASLDKPRPAEATPREKAKTSSQAAGGAASAPKEAPSQKDDNLPVRLSIKARENCWVSLKVDGEIVFMRILEKGRYESWQGKEKMELALGNAGVVDLEVNGKLFTNLGRRGQARKNIIITKAGLNLGR
ncbi:MAG: RodZ domain-containing protein [Candidatus Omnitrophota bacterium]